MRDFYRFSRPDRSPRLLAAVEQQRICADRRRSGWGPRLIAGETGHADTTVCGLCSTRGISRPARQPRELRRRYDWPCPGDLLHIDARRFVRFSRPGHAVAGDRQVTGAEKRMRVALSGCTHSSLITPGSPIASSIATERAVTVTAFVERGLAFYAAHAIEPKRLLSDNAFVYRKNRGLQELLKQRSIQRRFIRSRRPQPDGKVVRFQHALKRERALGETYRTSGQRAQALSPWLDYYTRRPHSSLGGRPPISRVHSLPREDS